ncbi:MAG: DUF2344 domain-containing protein [Chloroflexi bacterium]|nr:DUF2344 domain-containing protein [Chloroflexota bacterium]
MDNKLIRLKITFAKTDAMRYTSHLDLQRTWERTLRRARLPLAYSQGFNPRPKINLGAALPLGFTGAAELIEVWLEDEILLEEIESTLTRALPPGIVVQEIVETINPGPKLQNLIYAASYHIILSETPQDIASTVDALLAQDEILQDRRGKRYDLRPLIEELRLNEDGTLHLQVSTLPGKTGRPDEVLLALGIDPLTARIQRTKLLLKAN